MCERALWFCEQQILRCQRFAFEWSCKTQGWSAVQAMGELLALYQDVLFWADDAGYRVDCRCPWTNELPFKDWFIFINSRELANALNLVCMHNFKLFDAILLPEAWNKVVFELEAISTDSRLHSCG